MLEIYGLRKSYGSVIALRGVSLTVEEGMFGLLGPNGAGKTTLMKIIVGLLAPDSGSVVLDSVDVVADPGFVHRQLGYLPQEFGFHPGLSGRSMLAYLLRLKGLERPRLLADELLHRVGLGAVRGRKIRSYSGGMRQRLGIAQALAGDPRILVVDEPTAGLDPEERHRIYRLLAELAQDRIVILSTHIVEDVAVLCSRFGVMLDGRIVALTRPEEALAALDGKIREGLLDAERLPEFEQERLVTLAVLARGRYRVRVYDDGSSIPEEFATVPATLEDAYMVVVKRPRSDLLHARGAPGG